MTYPGNPALAPDVQQRIRSTFEHTMGLAAGGSRQEALLGCDFVLRMDPQFTPAQRLQERLGAAMGAVEVEDLRALLAGGQVPAAPDGWHDFLDTALPDLPELPELGAAGATAAPPAPGRHAGGDLASELRGLLEQRRFQEVLARAEHDQQAVAADPELRRLVSTAQERLEAGPYVVRFLTSARDAMRAGETAEAGRLIEKARALDPSHPGIAEQEATTAPAAPRIPLRPPAAFTPAAPSAPTLQMPRTPPAAEPQQPSADLPFQIEDVPPETPYARASPAPANQQASAPQGIELAPLRTMAIPVFAGAQPAGGDAESERRIQQLLDEGDAALAGGDPQAAIDAWSRIFLIDIDHQEASRRIEQARRVKAENERQVEEIFHDGLARLERRDTAGARRAFERVLELQPGHLASREYLQQITDGTPGVAPPVAPLSSPLRETREARESERRAPGATLAGAAAAAAAAAGTTAAAPGDPPPLPATLTRPGDPGDELKEEILVPPDLGKAAARTEPRREARTGHAGDGRGKRLFAIIGSAVLLLLAAVGWFVYQNHDQWFPNSQAEEPPPPAAAANPIARARRLHDTGKAAIALSQLRRVPPGDPHYQEAQDLIRQWEGPAAAAGSTGAGSTVTAPSPDGAMTAAGGAPLTPEEERRQQLLAEGRQAYGAQSYLVAAQKFEQADRLAKLDGPEAASYADAQQRIAPLARQLAMFRQHDWEFALPDLWRMHEADPANHDVSQLIVDCYYDLGVRELQRNDPAKAASNFNEAATLDHSDKSLTRQLLFAQTYQTRQPDLLYRIYIKYLPLR